MDELRMAGQFLEGVGGMCAYEQKVMWSFVYREFVDSSRHFILSPLPCRTREL